MKATTHGDEALIDPVSQRIKVGYGVRQSLANCKHLTRTVLIIIARSVRFSRAIARVLGLPTIPK